MTRQNKQFTSGSSSEKLGCNFFQNAKPNPDSLVSKLRRGTSVAVLGLRRIGKTSLLAETRERLRATGKNVIWVNLDSNDTPVKALSVILNSMQKEGGMGLIASMRNWAENTEMIPADLKAAVNALLAGAVDGSSVNFDEKYVEVLFRQTGRILESQESENKPIIIFDELTTLIKNTIDNSKSEETRIVVGKLNSFLGLLRYWRTDEVGIRMAVSGSVSFNWLNREYGVRSDSINDCVRVNIEEMDRDGAKELLDLCVEAESLSSWSQGLREDLIEFLPAYYPGVVQLAFEVVSSETTPLENLDDLIRDKINLALWDHYFAQFATRYQKYPPAMQNRIVKLFDVLDKQAGGKIDGHDAEKILDGVNISLDEPSGRDIIYQLKSDSFVEIVSGGIRYSSGLVPAWRNFGKSMCP